MTIVSSSLSAFMQREQPFSKFSFPRWQSVLAITLLGVLTGLDPRVSAPQPGMPEMSVMSPGLAIGFSLVMVWACFLVCVGVVRWWVKRNGRWDGDGDIFNLLAAVWLVPDALAAGLTILGLPPLVGMALWLYSVWVAGHALDSAIPRVSLGYAILGVLISVVLMSLIMLVASVGMGLFLMGGVPPAPPAAPSGGG
ncbi:MAG: hypothetical protein Q4B17_06685 [Lautropia sp.]|nr:hypothetical protein [Lautropia sp.]